MCVVKIKLPRVITLCVICLLLITTASNEDSDICMEESDGTILWPEAKCSTCVKSTPFCLSEDKEIVTRCCGPGGIWEERPKCTSFQETITNPCPLNFINNMVNNTCMVVIENTTYPPSCPYGDNLPFYEYVSDVDPGLFPIWMPVVRDTERYGIGLLHWMEATENYKTSYTACDEEQCNEYYFSEYLIGKDCLVYHNNSHAEAVHCNGSYTAICSYKILRDRRSSLCIRSFPSSLCMQSDYSPLSTCFCRGTIDEQYTSIKAEFLQPYQNLLYPAISFSDDVCHIGIHRSEDGIYNWAYSNTTISYTNWGDDAIFGEEYVYGGMTPSGWILTKTDNELKCVLYQAEPPVDESEISLEYDLQNEQFSMKLTNPLMWLYIENGSFPMVFCFTDAASDSLITRVDVTVSLILTKYIYYSFPPHSDGPGTYWCEAFAYPDISIKRSNEFLFRYPDTLNEEYAVILKTNYVRGTNPLTEYSVKLFQKLLADQIPSLPNISSFCVRIYKIVEIDEDKLEITINFHLTNPVKSEPLRFYSALRGYMEQNIMNFSFVNVFGVDSCVGIQTVSPSQTVTWPITPINSVAPRPREGYCVRKDGSIMSRYCVGDYIDGAQWLDLDEVCTIQKSTNITVNLTNIVNLNNSSYYINQVAEIAVNYLDFTPVDVQLISEFLAQIASSNEINLNLTADIISNLMAVPDSVLRDSQNIFNATDRILYYVDEIIKNAQFIGEFITENLVITSYTIIATNVSGIALQESASNVEKIFDIGDIEQIENLRAAVVLSDDLRLQISQTKNYDSRIIVTIYKKSSLFVEINHNNKNLDVIFGVLLPDFDDQLSGKIYTIYNIRDIGTDFNCSFWNYTLGTKRGEWEYEPQTVDSDLLITCAYDHLTHLAVVQKEVVNITYELESILFSDDSLSEKLEKAYLLTKSYYSKFQPVDVLLLSKIIFEATESNEDYLDVVADILSQVIDIPAEILQKSQLMYNATGKMLIYFDQILQQVRSSKILQRTNFYAIIQFLDEDFVYGFTIDNCKGSCNFTVLRTESSVSDISAIDNLDSALLISKDLINQLVNGGKENYTAKIVVTIFFKDALFIEDYGNPKITTKVVGVSIPNFDDALNGGINVLNTVDFNIASNYTCSVYISDDDEATYEKGFWNSESPPDLSKNYLDCRFWKPGYYALIYSLINFTSSLEYMLNSDQPVESILNQTYLITTNYVDYLQPMDVFIISQLLAKVIEVNEVILEVSLDIVSNVMTITRDTLQISQKLYNATDKILYYFDRIAEKYNTSKEIYKDNVILIVSLLSETGLYGLTIKDCLAECAITILYNTSFIGNKDITASDIELKITSDLISQLLRSDNDDYIPKLILTIYYNDALFNEEIDRRNTSKIFGINFPKYNGTFPSEIKLSFNPNITDLTEGYNCALWEYQEDDDHGIVKGSWSSQSQARSSDMLTCNFYQQSYFTLVAGSSIYSNITDALISVLDADISFPEKLYKTEDISYNCLDFADIDIYLVSEILAQCDQLGDDSVTRLIVIINNILQVPRNVIINAHHQYNALKQILSDINYVANFVKSHSYCSMKDQFALIVCPLNPVSVSGVIVTKTGISCMYNIDEESVTNTDGAVAGILLSKEVLNQTISNMNISKIIFTIFSDNAFFDTDNTKTTSAIILGISMPNFKGVLEGNITALFNNSLFAEVGFDCAIWEDVNIWSKDTAGQDNTGLFTKCMFERATYLTLREQSPTGVINISEILNEILTSNLTGTEKLNLTATVVHLYTYQLKAVHVHLVAQIESYVHEVSLVDLEKTAEIVSNIMKISREILVESQEKYNATDWILYQVDRIAGLFEGTAEIELENFAIIVTNNITGLFIETGNLTSETFRVHIIRGAVNLTSLKTNDDVNTALILDDLLVAQMHADALANIVLTIHFNDALFNEGFNVSYKNIGQIIGAVIPSLNDEIKGSVKVYYYSQEDSPELCAFWNYTVKNDEIMRGHWERDRVSMQPSELCLCESSQATHFAILQSDKNVTGDLESILNSNSSIREKLEKVAVITTELSTTLTPVDIYLISKILLYALNEVSSEEISLTSHIISGLFHVPRQVLRESQVTYSATDRILHSIDEMARLMDRTDEAPIVQEYFIIAVYDLKATNISGLLLEDCGSMKCNISTLENSVNLTDLARNSNLETAIALSDDLLEQVRHSKGSPKLAVTVFFSDVLFNEPVEKGKRTSMVCGVLLPGLNESLAGSLYLMFNTAEYVDYNNSCAFWNFQVTGEEEVVSGSWWTDVDPRSKEHFTICEFDHITHFALLLANDNSTFADKYKVLDIITAVNCVLSLVGIFGILLTAALFERWRKNTGNQILMNFSIAISIKMIMLYVSVGVYQADVHDVLCSITGAILHYALLSEFCWMLIIAILQFKRFVEVLGGPPKYVLLKACVCGWVFPILPVILILLIDGDNYNEGQVGLCYPSGLALYLGIWLPLIIIITINFVIFIFIIYNVFHKKTESRDIVNHEILFQWRLALLLFSMLGLTWLFGFMSQIQGATYIFVYLFCFTATLQGFVMFLFFIVFNKSTRFLYAQAIKLWLYSRGYKVQ